MRAALVPALALALALARPAFAGPSPTPADREAARAFANRGYELFEAGEFARAVEEFQKADERFHAPPHWLYIARAQAQLRKLLAARASYERVLAEKLPADAPVPFKDAQVSAKAELRLLEKRIPKMALKLEGPNADKAKVTIDDEPVDVDGLDELRAYDPGLHRVTAELPGEPPVERAIHLKEGAEARETITLEVRWRGKVPAILTFTAGGLALGAGGVLLGIYYTTEKKPDDALRIAGIASLAGGVALVGTGAVLTALRPTRNSAALPVRIGVGPGAITVGGAF